MISPFCRILIVWPSYIDPKGFSRKLRLFSTCLINYGHLLSVCGSNPPRLDVSPMPPGSCPLGGSNLTPITMSKKLSVLSTQLCFTDQLRLMIKPLPLWRVFFVLWTTLSPWTSLLINCKLLFQQSRQLCETPLLLVLPDWKIPLPYVLDLPLSRDTLVMTHPLKILRMILLINRTKFSPPLTWKVWIYLPYSMS